MTSNQNETASKNGKRRSLRDRQKDLTRTTIIEALGQILIEEGIHGFSVQSVADRAGVSHRTVYRHFPSREALLEGLAEKMNSLSTILQIPESLDDFQIGIASAFQLNEDHSEMMTAFLQIAVTTGFRAQSTRARDEATRSIVKEVAPALSPQEQKEMAALIRFLGSSVAWMIFKTQFGLSSDEATRIAQYGIRIIHKDLLRRNRAAEKGTS